MIIEKNVVVSLTYILRKNDSNGELLEECTDARPLEFVYDGGSMLPHFEKNLKGLQAGSEFDFSIDANNAYGVVNEDAIVEVSKDIFIVDGQVRDDLLQVGKIIPMRDNHGNPLNGKIVEVDNDKNIVLIDFNHPLAGLNLHFTGKIVDVREATAEELSYGVGGSASGCGCGGSCGDGGGGCGSDDCGSEGGGGCGSGSCGCGH